MDLFHPGSFAVVSGFSRSAPAFLCLFHFGSLLSGRSRSLQQAPSMVLICRSERVLPLSTRFHLPFPSRFVAERQKPLTTASPVNGPHLP